MFSWRISLDGALCRALFLSKIVSIEKQRVVFSAWLLSRAFHARNVFFCVSFFEIVHEWLGSHYVTTIVSLFFTVGTDGIHLTHMYNIYIYICFWRSMLDVLGYVFFNVMFDPDSTTKFHYHYSEKPCHKTIKSVLFRCVYHKNSTSFTKPWENHN